MATELRPIRSEADYEAALEELHRHNNETRFGGELIRRVPQAMP